MVNWRTIYVEYVLFTGHFEKSMKVAKELFVLLIAVYISCVNSETEFIVEFFSLNPPSFFI